MYFYLNTVDITREQHKKYLHVDFLLQGERAKCAPVCMCVCCCLLALLLMAVMLVPCYHMPATRACSWVVRLRFLPSGRGGLTRVATNGEACYIFQRRTRLPNLNPLQKKPTAKKKNSNAKDSNSNRKDTQFEREKQRLQSQKITLTQRLEKHIQKFVVAQYT